MEFKKGLIEHMNEYIQNVNSKKDDKYIRADYLIGLIEMKNVVLDYLLSDIDINDINQK